MKYVARHNKFYGALVKNLVKNPFFASSSCMYFCSWHASKQFSIFSPFSFIICYWILSWSIKKINFVCLFDISILIRFFFASSMQKRKQKPFSLRCRILHLFYSFFVFAYCRLTVKKSTQLLKSSKSMH